MPISRTAAPRARAALRPSTASSAVKPMRARMPPVLAPAITACRSKNSGAKPGPSGSAAIPAAPASISMPRRGMPRISPPSQSSEVVPVASFTAPAPRNSIGLNSPCAIAQSKAAWRAREASAGSFIALARKRDAEPDRDQPDMLDGRAGEHGLHLDFQHGPERADQDRGGARDDEQHAPPGLLGAAEHEESVTDEHIKCDFDHAAGHHRRNARGWCRMRARQPGMQGRQPRFGAGTEQYQHKSQRPYGQKQCRNEAGGGKHRNAGIKRRGPPIALQHQQPGGRTHQLETENQRKGIRRNERQYHAQHKHPERHGTPHARNRARDHLRC